MTRTALLVGGTAATGRAIIDELQARGYDVTLYNRGRFNHTLDQTGLRFITGDPHFRETIQTDLGGCDWDVVVASYGRTRLLAEALAGRTGQFVAVGGTPVCRLGAGAPLHEDDPVADARTSPVNMTGIVPKIARTEQDVLNLGKAGGFAATIVRYPYVYGPHSLVPMEWHVIQRVRDGRRRWALAGGGLQLTGRCAAPNAAGVIGAVLDRPDVAAGRIFHAGDRRQFTQRQWVTLIAGMLGHSFEFVDIPPSVAPVGSSAIPMAGEFLFSQNAGSVADGWLEHNMALPSLAERDLGYRERVDPLDWLRRTVDYWLANPYAVPAGDVAPLGSADFDYAAEDALLGWWDTALADVPAFGAPIRRGHPYDHPKAASA
ncbi:hypothetical protein [Gemmobacter sp.]|uniref:hypothetical protein n=1 Tax=Gemmobacter sp. TaxID=1898957 RepID=UPI002AFF6A44|nr:hypothetical protein [Gemmobacter sp.]